MCSSETYPERVMNQAWKSLIGLIQLAFLKKVEVPLEISPR